LDIRVVLPEGTILDESYRILRVVGSGGFGITYEAEDIRLGTSVAIKEYYPHDFGERVATMSVRPRSERHEETFDWGRSNFLKEARTLARFEHPSILRVTRIFEANSTAYMVMRFERGQSFEYWLRSLSRSPTQEELDRIVTPLLDALETLHSANFLHRDIAPDNIVVRDDGSPVLLDFGAARHAVAEMTQALTGIVKAGYSPYEQYSSDRRLQGTWSDIYALGATLYRAIAGSPPEEATLRLDDDQMVAATLVGRGRYRLGFLAAIDACLKVRPSERPQSVVELRQLLAEERRHSLDRLIRTLRPAGKPATPSSKQHQPAWALSSAWQRWSFMIAALGAILVGAYGGYRFTQGEPSEVVRQGEIEAPRGKEAEAKRQAEVKRQGEIEEQKRPKEAEERRLAELKRQTEIEAQRKVAIEQERALIRKGVFRDCDSCPDVVVVRAGEFMMGSSKSEIDAGSAEDNEGPQRKIVIPQSLAVGRFEVTRDQFEAFVRSSGHKVADKCWSLEDNEPRERADRSFRNPGYPQNGSHPAVCVSWDDATAYANWLSTTTGKSYRLLSEARWEYAARAGTIGANAVAEADVCTFGNGADQTAKEAKLPGNWAYLACTDGYSHTAPVGSFKPNAFGLYDLMGNVWEWVEDCYGRNLTEIPTDGGAHTSSDCREHTVRGGAWSTPARMLRTAVRAKAPAGARFDDVGFRVVRTLSIEP
jgi:formylglycine-generating enzyme required for sulfatase activity/serine/threonine protein kinase